MRSIRPAPPLFLGVLFRSTLLTWVLARLVVAAVASVSPVGGGSPVPPGGPALVGIVTVLAWLDLRRRNQWTLLPTLGLSAGVATLGIAVVVALAELLLMVLR